MSKTDKSKVIIITGDNNKISFGGHSALSRAIVTLAIAIVFGVAVLVISLCCPDLLADTVRWMISSIINS